MKNKYVIPLPSHNCYGIVLATARGLKDGAVLGTAGAVGATFRGVQDGGSWRRWTRLALALSHLLMTNLHCTLDHQEPVSLCRRRVWGSHSTAGETIKLRHGALESGPLGVHGGLWVISLSSLSLLLFT